MALLTDFFQAYWMYCQEIWLSLAIGFLLSGLFYKFISTDIVDRHLGETGLRPILISSFVGVLLPVCCIGSLPIAITLRRKGASLGATLAFLVATPATSISALIVCWKLLGALFTVIIFWGAVIMAVVMGIATNRMTPKLDSASHEHGHVGPCCHEPQEHNESIDAPFLEKIKQALHYAFITLPRMIGLEILVGIAIASFIMAFEPLRQVVHSYLTGLFGYLFVVLFGLLTYVCSTASVPMADALINSGLSHGQALCYLLVGPVTSYGTILVIKKDFGKRVLAIYLGIICAVSLTFGLIYDMCTAVN